LVSQTKAIGYVSQEFCYQFTAAYTSSSTIKHVVNNKIYIRQSVNCADALIGVAGKVKVSDIGKITPPL